MTPDLIEDGEELENFRAKMVWHCRWDEKEGGGGEGRTDLVFLPVTGINGAAVA